MIATRCGAKEEIATLILQGAQIDAHDDFGFSPLHHAAQGSADLVEQLLLAGASLHTKHRTKGFTPLHMAIWCGNKGTAVALVQAGASLSFPDAHGVTPLRRKSRTGVSEMQLDEVMQACLTAVTMQEIREKSIERILTRAYIHLGEDGVK